MRENVYDDRGEKGDNLKVKLSTRDWQQPVEGGIIKARSRHCPVLSSRQTDTKGWHQCFVSLCPWLEVTFAVSVVVLIYCSTSWPVSTPSYVSLLNPKSKLDMRTWNMLPRTATRWVALSISGAVQGLRLGIIPVAQSTPLLNDS